MTSNPTPIPTYTLIFGKYDQQPLYSETFLDIPSAVRQAAFIIEQWLHSPVPYIADYCRLYGDSGTLLWISLSDIETSQKPL